jgi:hypothetical protein
MEQLYLLVRSPGRPSARIELIRPGTYWVGSAEACQVRIEGAAAIEGALFRTADRLYGMTAPHTSGLRLGDEPLSGQALRVEDELRAGDAVLVLGAFDVPKVETVSQVDVAAEPFRWAAEATLRLLADRVPRKTRERARKVMQAHDQEYPWQEVVSELVAEPVDRDDLLRRVLIAQRNLLVRGNADGQPRKPSIVKRGVAVLVARSVFFTCQLLVVIALLIVLQARWPAVDV